MVVPGSPELSAYVFAQFKNEDREQNVYLRVDEIAQLKIAADFGNLSAWETGLGKIYNGEGVVGLIQGFLVAGANGVSVSLWRVADDSTGRFMNKLYNVTSKEKFSFNKVMNVNNKRFIRGEYGG